MDYKVTSYHINKLCVCGDAGQSVKFSIIPTTLGHIPLTVTATTSSASLCSNSTVFAQDAVTRKLLVEVCKNEELRYSVPTLGHSSVKYFQ